MSSPSPLLRRLSSSDSFRDGPLDPWFWLGGLDARLAGLFRAGLGTILLGDALITIPHVEDLYGPNGVWSPLQGSGLLVGLSEGGLQLAWLGGCLALLAFALGLFSRVSALLSFIFLVSVHQRNIGVATGGDFLAQILVFFCIWLDTGSAFSLDARLRGKGKAFVAAAPWRAMQVHLALLYFATARLKLHGDWGTGNGVYVSLQLLGFLRPPGVLLLEHPAWCRVLNWAVLGAEGAFAFFALSPFKGRIARLGAMACGLGVQLGILSMMRVGVFTVVMLWCAVLFLPGREAPREPRPLERLSPAGWAFAVVPLCFVVITAWSAFLQRRLPLPGLLARGLDGAGLVQPFQLFGDALEVAQWHSRGTRRDGRSLDVLDAVEPGFESVVGWSYSPFYKLSFHDRLQAPVIARWLCRKYERAAAQPLDSLELWKDARPPRRVDDSADPPSKKVVLFSGPCSDASIGTRSVVPAG